MCMALSCSWCGELRETSVDDCIVISHEERTGVEYNPNADITGSAICPECTERLAEKGAVLRGVLGLPSAPDDWTRARQMLYLIDTVNSEPPGRDWEDTTP